MFGRHGVSERGLEFSYPRALSDPSGFDRRRDGRHLVGAEPRLHHVDAAHETLAVRPAAIASRCGAHHSTSLRSPTSRGTCAEKPRSRRASEVSASRRTTPLTARGGKYSIGRSESMAHSSALARSFRLVSTWLATLYTPSVMLLSAARMLARAISSV